MHNFPDDNLPALRWPTCALPPRKIVMTTHVVVPDEFRVNTGLSCSALAPCQVAPNISSHRVEHSAQLAGDDAGLAPGLARIRPAPDNEDRPTHLQIGARP